MITSSSGTPGWSHAWRLPGPLGEVPDGEHWYRLMEVNFAAERYEDAVDAGLRATPWLEEAWHLIAECYRRSAT